MTSVSIRSLLSVLIGLLFLESFAFSHDLTRPAALRRRAAAKRVAARRVALQDASPQRRLTVRLLDAQTGKPISGAIRITPLDEEDDRPLVLRELIERDADWYTMAAATSVRIPVTPVRIEAMRGIETLLATSTIPAGDAERVVELRLKRFHNIRKKGWRSGNTHLHLMDRTFAEADRYLREAPLSDDLDLVFLSHLRRIPDERRYISNMIVENSLPGGDLARLSKTGIVFGPGEEHRHNFGIGGEGYGHVMLLDIAKLIRPVSIGPGIMRKGTDGIPLQRGIKAARKDGATVVWCHNAFGFEDIPNWAVDLVHAQNIFDGGNRGSYEESFYRYLNIGKRVPFSTGTDWFIDDFSRVYVPLEGELTSARWLQQLKAGRSFITNGPMLEFTAGGRAIGETLKPDGPITIRVKGRAVGRDDFGQLEVVHNGEVVSRAATAAKDRVYGAEISLSLRINGPGWLALRTPLHADRVNAFGKRLYAHTSPIYIEMAGKRIFRKKIADGLIQEIREAMRVIDEKGVFADQQERDAVLNVYREGIRSLTERGNPVRRDPGAAKPKRNSKAKEKQ